MSPRHRRVPILLTSLTLLAPPSSLLTQSPPLSRRETRARDWLAAHEEEAIDLLLRAVNQSSGTLNLSGVRAVGALFRRELDALGFTTRWVELPPELKRAGHLVAERRGPRVKPDGTRLLLIGHLDTVFEGDGQRFVRADSVARGAGTTDMMGGDVALLSALKALHAAGALDEMQVIVVLTGDEESPGQPLDVSRKDLVEAAKRGDAALAFEAGGPGTATVARRGASHWILTASGRQGHSSGIFGAEAGYGAIYEAARILDAFRRALAGQPHLTFNPGAITGGTDVSYDTVRVRGTAAGKTNIIAREAWVQGDLRFLTEPQKDSARSVMRAIVAEHLPGTSAEIRFGDAYPAMPPTEGNLALLRVLDQASRDLGYPGVEPFDPDRRGAGDISFVAPFVDGLDGLGADGFGAHSPEEGVYLPSIRRAAERAAVVMLRLAAKPRKTAAVP